MPATAGSEARVFAGRRRTCQAGAHRVIDFGADLPVDAGHLALLFCAERFHFGAQGFHRCSRGFHFFFHRGERRETGFHLLRFRVDDVLQRSHLPFQSLYLRVERFHSGPGICIRLAFRCSVGKCCRQIGLLVRQCVLLFGDGFHFAHRFAHPGCFFAEGSDGFDATADGLDLFGFRLHLFAQRLHFRFASAAFRPQRAQAVEGRGIAQHIGPAVAPEPEEIAVDLRTRFGDLTEIAGTVGYRYPVAVLADESIGLMRGFCCLRYDRRCGCRCGQRGRLR